MSQSKCLSKGFTYIKEHWNINKSDLIRHLTEYDSVQLCDVKFSKVWLTELFSQQITAIIIGTIGSVNTQSSDFTSCWNKYTYNTMSDYNTILTLRIAGIKYRINILIFYINNFVLVLYSIENWLKKICK